MNRLRWIPRLPIAGLVLAVGAACADGDVFIAAEVPPEIRWVAVAFEDAQGRTLSAGELRELDPSEALRIERDPGGDRTRVLGYSRAQLEPIASILDAIEDRPLEPATACAPTLPDPAWNLLIEGEQAVPASLASLPRLTAPWLESACPAARFGVDVRSPWCDQTMLSASGCAFELSLSSCPLDAGSLRGWRSPFGEAPCVLEAPEASGCEVIDPGDDAVYLALDCSSGSTIQRVEVMAAPNDPRFEVETVTVLPLADNPGVSGGKSQATFSGPLSDLLALRDHLVVADLDEVWSTLLLCDGERPSGLHLFDRGTLEAQGIIAGPTCTTQLAKLAGDNEMVALGWRASDQAIIATRFVDTSSVVSASYPTPVIGGRAVDAFVLFEELVVLLSSDNGRKAELLIIDPDDLSLLDRIDLTHFSNPAFDAPEAISMFPYRDGQVLVTDDRRNRFFFVDVPNRQVLGDGVDVAGSRNVYVGAGYYSVDLDRILIAISDSNAAVHTFSSDTFLRHVFPIEHSSDPVSFAAWPSDPGRVLVGFVDKPENTARVSLMDPTAPRLWAGSQIIGEGTVSRLEPGPDGEIWALLPWSGRVARLRAR